ncbi:methylenetetrahydrofolate reductase [NAD(P)H] [Treponema zuelzerae]|uniref:Methylenetetrahydrofolate reductase n=1 Tax=Teretinema zuelzerae TaxID=156 RepID=A0AAE3JKL4_9SPIR|nr:methylenetetrahydrofolate reductase [NAD(P)H] [Teretinema zuelzerae]MBN2812400.1 methylenetetrahydrofolate reductase [NAD(P)H] [Spirochaetales bacterium]MCD1655375.1 methylenetetrahydrofolate reductase [NAD(P)H] [Teretinema zuelzerae]
MKIDHILDERKLTVSYEIFPPKQDSAFDSVIACAEELAELDPDFISVTYGAGGGTSANTVKICSHLQSRGVTPLAHLTCLSSTKDHVHRIVDELKDQGIENILALRGDRPKDPDFVAPGDYRYASDLVSDLKTRGEFCIGGACYPEGHPESGHKDRDLANLKTKVDAGCSFLTTQMFFDNNMLYSFLYRAQAAGIRVPILAGIMPVTNGNQLKRMMELSNAYLPPKFLALVDRFGDNNEAMKQAGIAYATEQIIDLVTNGVRGIHIYAMNKPDVIRQIVGNISAILREAR